MPPRSQRGYVSSGGTPDVGADRWGKPAYKPGSQAKSNQMPTGMDNSAKNGFGAVLADGRVTDEDADQGYCDYGYVFDESGRL